MLEANEVTNVHQIAKLGMLEALGTQSARKGTLWTSWGQAKPQRWRQEALLLAHNIRESTCQPQIADLWPNKQNERAWVTFLERAL